MSTRTAATRYAKALLDVAGDDAVALERDLTAFAGLLGSNAELHQALLSPSVSARGKQGIVTAVAARLNIAPVGVKLLQLLADRDRLGLVDEMLAVYRERLLDRQKIVKAHVRSAAPLSADALKAIETRLGVVTGKNVSIEAAVDPALLGGVVATVGSTVYDGSVKTQLEKLRKQLVGAGG
jgi:F-type H+-transporting ATPase subunit delta